MQPIKSKGDDNDDDGSSDEVDDMPPLERLKRIQPRNQPSVEDLAEREQVKHKILEMVEADSDHDADEKEYVFEERPQEVWDCESITCNLQITVPYVYIFM